MTLLSSVLPNDCSVTKRLRLFTAGVSLLAAVGFIADGSWVYAKAVLAQILIEDAWQRTDNSPVKPWPWADTWPVARLSMPQHEVDLYVLNGVQGSALAFGPGYMQGSAPVGTMGTTVIAGHRDTHFSFLKNVRRGDAITLSSREGRRLSYKVVSLEVVDSRSASLTLDQQQSQLLLVTCYPFDAIDAGGPLRYVVVATNNDFAVESGELQQIGRKRWNL